MKLIRRMRMTRTQVHEVSKQLLDLQSQMYSWRNECESPINCIKLGVANKLLKLAWDLVTEVMASLPMDPLPGETGDGQ
jgi:hypothetical protein